MAKQRVHTTEERYRMMVLWWAGCSEADIARRSGLRSKARFRSIRNVEAKGQKPRSEMTTAERQAILDRMRQQIPEGVVMPARDFIAKEIDQRRQVRVRRRDYGGREEVVFYGDRDDAASGPRRCGPRVAPSRPAPEATTPVADLRPGRDGQPFTEETFSEARSPVRQMRNIDVDQVEALYSRGMLLDPQSRNSSDKTITSSRWAATRRHTMARQIQTLMEVAGWGKSVGSVDLTKAGGGGTGTSDPSVAAFQAMHDLDQIRARMPRRLWFVIETLVGGGGLPALRHVRGRRFRPEEDRARKATLEMVHLALDYAATWPRSGQDLTTGRRFPLLELEDFATRWPDAVSPTSIAAKEAGDAELRASLARARAAE